MKSISVNELREAFASYLPLPAGVEPNLRGALSHVLGNEGSLVRPQIIFDLSRAYGLRRADSMDLAIALEYFHTASLIFDDLPCMDDSQARRGAPCVHLKFGESGAILAALALINRAYALIWRAVSQCRHGGEAHALEYIQRNLGVAGLLNGQSLDLNYGRLPHDLRTTERVALGKTVALIRLTLVLPAMLGGAPDREVQLLERIAVYWGLSYQIVDDLKDILQEPATTGKTNARDLSLNRPNIALAIGVAASVRRLGRLIALGDLALRRLLERMPDASFLGNLRSALREEMARVPEAGCDRELQEVS